MIEKGEGWQRLHNWANADLSCCQWKQEGTPAPLVSYRLDTGCPPGQLSSGHVWVPLSSQNRNLGQWNSATLPSDCWWFAPLEKRGDQYGGTGKVWSLFLIPPRLPHPGGFLGSFCSFCSLSLIPERQHLTSFLSSSHCFCRVSRAQHPLETTLWLTLS